MPPIAPSAVQASFALALQHHRAGRLGEAERLYRQILQAEGRHADTLHMLGVLAHQAGRHEAAAEFIGRAIAQAGRIPAFHNNLGNALQAQNRLEDAALCYAQALLLKPDYAEAHYNLGVTLQTQGKLDAAATSYRRALAHKPNHAEAYGNLGNVLQEQGKLNEAVAAYSRALSHKPNYAEAQSNLANVYRSQGKLAEAVVAYGAALALKPNYAEAHSNLSIVLMEQGRLDDAALSCGRALAHKADFAEAHTILGNILREQGKQSEAIASYGRALALRPDYAEARLGLAVAAIPLLAANVADSACAGDRFSRSLDELAAWAGTHLGPLGKSVGAAQPFYLAYRPFDVSAPLARYGDIMCRAAAAHWQVPSVDRRPVGERVRIVVVSGQVRRHPVWDIVLRGIIAHIDRRRFEVILYHTNSMVDAETDWASGRVDRFVQGPRPLQSWLAEVAQDRPDVMFYPEVGMDPATCALAALRLAPTQVAGWGHPVTTGLPTMDLYLSGELLEGPGAARHYREKLVRLPGTGVCTEPVVAASRRWEAPARPERVIRFALCHQPIKFDPADDALLPLIARAAGPCEFWLVSPKKLDWATARLHGRLAATFRAAGLDPDLHLHITPWLARDEFTGFLDEMDVYLDCPAFSGYTTAWQAVHRGVPIVTLEGEFLRQRLAAGLLRQIGATDGIVSSRDHYVEIAVRWAHESRQPEQRAARREAIRQVAANADGNRAAIAAIEKALMDAVRAPTSMGVS